ncbi:hypothetical protein ACF1AJ_20520 [Leifsonia sp. NPDC014704]|uniref:hypothetical protein n=1 Tax=Leifsonia sp. NPDC014704 TaxID=3364123 RepID=UPI0036F483E4
MTMVARSRVATRATGIRRQVFVHVYDDQAELARAHAEARDRAYDPDDDVAGGVAIQQGFQWPRPETTPVVAMRLWTGQLTTRTIAHEATHAAAAFYFMDCVAGWDSRARAHLMGDHEPLAYLIGDLAAEVTAELYRLGLLPNRPHEEAAG